MFACAQSLVLPPGYYPGATKSLNWPSLILNATCAIGGSYLGIKPHPFHYSLTCNIFRVELSSAKSTQLSIGVMINGTEKSPAAVGNHLDTNIGNPTLLVTAILEARTITINK